MKIIFLDFDGVLMTIDYLTKLIKNNEEIQDDHGNLFDPQAVQQFLRIVKETDAKVVVSSSWRLSGLNSMREMFVDRGIPVEIVDVTKCIWLPNGGNEIKRGEEIDIFLKEKGELLQVEQFVIIDDDTDFLPHQIKNFVHTDDVWGITEEAADKAIEILGKKG